MDQRQANPKRDGPRRRTTKVRTEHRRTQRDPRWAKDVDAELLLIDEVKARRVAQEQD
jgi:hypothetical protein